MFYFVQNRRERISERLKILQELVPNGTKVHIHITIYDRFIILLILMIIIFVMFHRLIWWQCLKRLLVMSSSFKYKLRYI